MKREGQPAKPPETSARPPNPLRNLSETPGRDLGEGVALDQSPGTQVGPRFWAPKVMPRAPRLYTPTQDGLPYWIGRGLGPPAMNAQEEVGEKPVYSLLLFSVCVGGISSRLYTYILLHYFYFFYYFYFALALPSGHRRCLS